jgi:hypothetical protein
MCGGFGSLDGNANFTRLKAALDVSIRCFQRSFYTHRTPFWQSPVRRRCIPENRRVGGLLMRIGDANFTQLNTPLHLSIRRFQRRFYTYRRQFWKAPVVHDASLRIEGCGGGGSEWALHWRSNFHSIESSVRHINTALSAKLLCI